MSLQNPEMTMRTAPSGLRKGAWTEDEDMLLRECIEKFGEGKWRLVPQRAGINRCRKSCRLRWVNYLSPNIKRGSFTVDEDDLIIRLHKLLGNRWSLIAGRLPGRTANDVKNHWNSHLKKMVATAREGIDPSKGEVATKTTASNILKPRPRTFSRRWSKEKTAHPQNHLIKYQNVNASFPISPPPLVLDHDMQWLNDLLFDKTCYVEEEMMIASLWNEEITPEIKEERKQEGQNGSIDFCSAANLVIS